MAIDLLHRKAYEPEAKRQAFYRALILAVLLGATVYFMGPKWLLNHFENQSRARIAFLNQEIDKHKQTLVQLQKEEEKVKWLVAIANDVHNVSLQRQAAVMIFNELAIITPEKTRLMRVEYANGHVVLEGVASEPKMVTAMLDNIKASVTFKNISFKGSNKMANEEAYTFIIEADVL